MPSGVSWRLRGSLRGFKSMAKGAITTATSGDSEGSQGRGFCITKEIFRATARSSTAKLETNIFTPFHLFSTVVQPESHEDLFHCSRASAQMLFNSNNAQEAKPVLQAALHDFCDAQSPDIPFVALDLELVGAFARAKAFEAYDDLDVKISIAVVDTRCLATDSLLSCNALRTALGMEKNDKYATKVLAWEALPIEAIKCCMPWSNIVGVIGKQWFPILSYPPLPEQNMMWEKLWTENPDMLRENSMENEPDVPDILQCLEKVFGMRAEEEATRHLVEIFIAWTLGHTKLRNRKRRDILVDLDEKIEEWVTIVKAARRDSMLLLQPLQSPVDSDEETIDAETAKLNVHYEARIQGSLLVDHEAIENDRIPLKTLERATPSTQISSTPMKSTKSSGKATRIDAAFELSIRNKLSSKTLSSYLSNDALSMVAKKDRDKQTRCSKVQQRATSRAASRARNPLLDDSDDNVLESLSKVWTAKRSDSATVEAPLG